MITLDTNNTEEIHLLIDSPPVRYAGHLWDYMLGISAWDFFSGCWNNVPEYVPTALDLALGGSLLDQWSNLTTFGNLSAFGTSMLPISSAPGFPASYALVVQNQTGPSVVVSYGQARCAALAAEPMSFNQSFWLCD